MKINLGERGWGRKQKKNFNAGSMGIFLELYIPDGKFFVRIQTRLPELMHSKVKVFFGGREYLTMYR